MEIMASLADVIKRGRKMKHIESKSKSETEIEAEAITIVTNTKIPIEEQSQPVHIKSYQSPRFEIGDPELVKYLTRYGYVVVRNVLSGSEIETAISKLWIFLSNHIHMLRNDSTTWSDENFRKIGSCMSGIMGGYGFGHSDFQWYIRLKPNVKKVFEQIYNDKDLVASYDGGNIFRPWYHVSESKSDSELELESDKNRNENINIEKDKDIHKCTSTGWFHVDQGRLLPDLCCIQSLITLTDCNEYTGGFCCIPKSQQYFDEIIHLSSIDHDDNYIQIPNDFPGLQDEQILPICEKGDMILWDSRTIHCSTPAFVIPKPDSDSRNCCNTATTNPTNPIISDQLLRIASYQCMTPRKLCNNNIIQKRIDAFNYNMTTTHWPHIADYSIPTSFGKPINDYQRVSNDMQELIGKLT